MGRSTAARMAAAMGLAAAAVGAMVAFAPVSASAQPARVAAELTATQIVVEGVVVRGVEGGCTLLRTDAGRHFQLLGAVQVPPPGTRVRVLGELLQVGTVCQQGWPLKVIRLETI